MVVMYRYIISSLLILDFYGYCNICWANRYNADQLLIDSWHIVTICHLYVIKYLKSHNNYLNFRSRTLVHWTVSATKRSTLHSLEQ